MKSAFITGATGFVGKNLVDYFRDTILFTKYGKNTKVSISEDIVIHLAGKAHDLKRTSSISEYYEVNTDFTKKIFDEFLISPSKVFITLSSVKAVADQVKGVLLEDAIPEPITHYGKSKLLAEQYILGHHIPDFKRVYILRPCMIHGPLNKGNLNLLIRFVKKHIPWPLGAFNNERSFCSIDNLCFIINELIERQDIPSGIYNIADDNPISTNELIDLIGKSLNLHPTILHIPKKIISFLAKMGDAFHLPINSERLQKLTQNYVVSNLKIKNAIGKSLPLSTKDGLLKTLKSFT